MKVSQITSFNNSFRSTDRKPSVLDKIHSYTKNSADMNDTVVVPRTIFKGYLAFMAGTTIASIASLIKSNVLRKSLSISGLFVCMYGTWAFVRPFVVKDAPGVSKTKPEKKHML